MEGTKPSEEDISKHSIETISNEPLSNEITQADDKDTDSKIPASLPTSDDVELKGHEPFDLSQQLSPTFNTQKALSAKSLQSIQTDIGVKFISPDPGTPAAQALLGMYNHLEYMLL